MDELSHWLGRVSDGLPAPAGKFALWHDESTRSTHTVTAWEPPLFARVELGLPDKTMSNVAIELAAQADGTVVSVQHDGVGDPASYAAGWHRHLDYLASHLAGEDESPADFWDGYDALAESARSAPFATRSEVICARCWAISRPLPGLPRRSADLGE